MKQYLSEKKALKELNIDDWNQMELDKGPQFATMLPYMNPETIKAIMSKIPNFVELSTSIIKTLSDNLAGNILKYNDKDEQRLYDFTVKTLDILQSQLEQPYISEERKNKIIDAIIEITRLQYDNREKNRMHVTNIVNSITSIAGLAVASVLVLIFGFRIATGGHKDETNSDDIEPDDINSDDYIEQ